MQVREAATRTLLQACLSQGLDLPYFCWHPSLGSVGACRQCAVDAVHGRRGRHGHARHGLHDAGRRRQPAVHQGRPKPRRFRASGHRDG
ncbi:MAG: 2Fe-2S iron-sulfur cluster-binding protein [Gammaproteobacteria bacterium]|nr:2Fe-2S iron-sulfur cluster-binding protein [Gammaproteobacteria bacterium]